MDTRWNGAEVVEVSVLSARGSLADKGAAAVHQVRTAHEHLAVDDEEL